MVCRRALEHVDIVDIEWAFELGHRQVVTGVHMDETEVCDGAQRSGGARTAWSTTIACAERGEWRRLSGSGPFLNRSRRHWGPPPMAATALAVATRGMSRLPDALEPHAGRMIIGGVLRGGCPSVAVRFIRRRSLRARYSSIDASAARGAPLQPLLAVALVIGAALALPTARQLLTKSHYAGIRVVLFGLCWTSSSTRPRVRPSESFGIDTMATRAVRCRGQRAGGRLPGPRRLSLALTLWTRSWSPRPVAGSDMRRPRPPCPPRWRPRHPDHVPGTGRTPWWREIAPGSG